MRMARNVFRVAGIYGLLVVFPLYFLEQRIGIDYPPAITHAEYFYGFIGVTLAWQIMFLFISTDPLRYRKLMIPCMIEKLSFVPAFFVLFPQGRFPLMLIPAGSIDLLLGLLFLLSFLKTPNTPPTA